MRTGVLLVEEDGRLRLANEAALGLLGDLGEGERSLAMISPEISRRLVAWLRDGIADDAPVRLGVDQLDVLPRFARLSASSNTTLVFLDDASLLSRRAESMTLATLGRFSASLAHEIRNPLAAISYATQLLQESTRIDDADARLLEIIHQQCMRTNGIVESVLGLARRERANPEHVDLVQFTRRFVDDYQQMLPPESGKLQASGGAAAVAALVDPRHLQQVLTVLVANALHYGRLPGDPARVTLRVQPSPTAPQIDVVDRGPGIPDAVASQLFRPFYTTSEHGTGLGLYIARELCHANGATLEFVAVPGGGSCFRLTLPGPHALMPG
jgi:two-component system sensor histidine kinase PilS (NtrC family)